jgi:hypothetical protein
MSSKTSFVEGNNIVVADKTALPLRCVKTNQPIGEAEYTIWDLPFIPSWLTTFMIFWPFLLIAAPFGARSRCRLRAGLCSSERKRYVTRKFIAAALILLSFIVPIVGLVLESRVVGTLGVVTFMPLFWGSFAYIILFSDPLKVTKHKDGQFWIRGCSAEFLKSLNTP